MSTNLLAAFKKLRASANEFFDAVDLELRALGVSDAEMARATGPRPKAAPPAEPAAISEAAMTPSRPTPPRPSARPGTATPPPAAVPQTAKPGAPAMSAETRARVMPEAVAIAKEVMQLIGLTNPQVPGGVRGQFALKAVPYDQQMLDEAIARAKAELSGG